MTKRKKFSEKEVIETLAHQGVIVACYRCHKPLMVRGGDGILYWVDGAEREHITEIALGGADAPHNCAYSHEACHAKITNGTKATTAGSSKQRIAKVRRLRGEGKPKARKRIQGRPFSKGHRPMQSRGFQKPTQLRRMP